MQSIINKKYSGFCLLSVIVILLALILSLSGLGMNIGMDFAGGKLISFDMGGEYSQKDITEALSEMNISGAVISRIGGDAAHEAQIRIKDIEKGDEIQAGLVSALQDKYPGMRLISADNISAAAGREVLTNAAWAAALVIILVFIYVAIRFDVYAAISAILAIAHDLLIMASLTVFFRMFIQVNVAYIAAGFAVLGFSLMNSITVFDAIRDAKKRLKRGDSAEDIVPRSVLGLRVRRVNITTAVILMLAALLIIGAGSIREFSLPLIFGMMSGIYSSNKINGHIWQKLAGAAKKRAKGKASAGAARKKASR